jgi:hypothetical protein
MTLGGFKRIIKIHNMYLPHLTPLVNITYCPWLAFSIRTH